MGPPRRVPWATKGELYELYDFLFSPTAYESSRKRGLARMNVYISSPSCPAFMFLLHNLLSAALTPPSASTSESQAARLMCSMAIVRFVNGLVDPLQTGPYARPISHIAASMNISPHLIALRHRATHEDLPSLRILQGAVGECIEYLHHYSFLPLLAESSSASNAYAGQLGSSRGEALVKSWKRVMKQRLRDRDVREDSVTGKEVARMKRDVEKMIQRGEQGEIVEALCGVEGLVPTAKSKRSRPDDTMPPEASIRIWQPLIEHVSALQPGFASLLANYISSVLLSDATESTKDTASNSFRWTLATWLLWLWTVENPQTLVALHDKKDLWNTLAHGLLVGDQTLRKLANALSSLDAAVGEGYQSLLRVLPPTENGVEVHLDEQSRAKQATHEDENVNEVEEEMKKLDDRMRQFKRVGETVRMSAEEQAMASRQRAQVAPPSQDTLAAASHTVPLQLDAESDIPDAPGWRRLRSAEWTPKPIGIFA